MGHTIVIKNLMAPEGTEGEINLQNLGTMQLKNGTDQDLTINLFIPTISGLFLKYEITDPPDIVVVSCVNEVTTSIISSWRSCSYELAVGSNQVWRAHSSDGI